MGASVWQTPGSGRLTQSPARAAIGRRPAALARGAFRGLSVIRAKNGGSTRASSSESRATTDSRIPVRDTVTADDAYEETDPHRGITRRAKKWITGGLVTLIATLGAGADILGYLDLVPPWTRDPPVVAAPSESVADTPPEPVETSEPTRLPEESEGIPGPSPEITQIPATPPLIDAAAMSAALIRLEDLDAEYHEFDPPAPGANRIQDDEFCGNYPDASLPQDQVRRFFGRGLLDNPKVFSTVAVFAPGGAEAFLANIRELSRCGTWEYTPTPNSEPIPQYITRLEDLGYGEDAVRVVVNGPPTPEIDFIYIRVGRLVGAIAYSVTDLPVVSGDERTDPRVTEILAEEMSRRLAVVEQ